MVNRENEGRLASRGAAGASDSGALSVSGAMLLAKGALEGVTVRLIGEVSEVSCKPGYKAAYFTVKDKKASLPCMMWNNRYEATGVRLAVGQLVELTGRFTLYAAKGRMNFDVLSLALAGEGMLRQQVADLARKLDAEGLMQASRKRALPTLPACVGLVTSPRGAAVHDVLRTLRRRFPLARVVVAGVPVEGREAPARIVEGMRTVCAAGAEVVLVVRGGGSFEDLMPFNDERLARAIAVCPVPVVTGIGHEPDTSIADMVSDLRASTPTAAAEAVAPAREQLEGLLAARGASLVASTIRRLERESAGVARLADRPVFRDAVYLFASEAQALDVAADRLARALPSNLDRDRARLRVTSDRLRQIMPRAVEHEHGNLAAERGRFVRALRLASVRESTGVASLRDRLVVRGGAIVGCFETELQVAAARLHDLSPLTVLARGYAVVRSEEGLIVKHVDQVEEGSFVSVALSDGELACRVEGTCRIETAVESWKENA